VDWEGFDRGYSRRKVELPTYTFQRQRYWVDGEGAVYLRERESKGHPFLGNRLSLAHSDVIYESQFDVKALSFLRDHKIYGRVVVPGASHIAMVLSGLGEEFGTGVYVILDVEFPNALVFTQEEIRPVQLILSPRETGEYEFEVCSLEDDDEGYGEWKLHARGTAKKEEVDSAAQIIGRDQVVKIRKRCQQERSGNDYYEFFTEEEEGIELGPRFRWIDRLWVGEGEVFCQMRMPEELRLEVGDYQLYPGLIDSCFQLFGAVFSKGMQEMEEVYVPMGLGEFRFYRPGDGQLWCYVSNVRLLGESGETMLGDIALFDEEKKSDREIQDEIR